MPGSFPKLKISRLWCGQWETGLPPSAVWKLNTRMDKLLYAERTKIYVADILLINVSYPTIMNLP